MNSEAHQEKAVSDALTASTKKMQDSPNEREFLPHA